MADKVKKLCKWGDGKYTKSMKKLRDAVLPPKYVCAKCGRVGSRKKQVCKPVDLESE